VQAGPRRWRSQACIVGGSEGDAISGVDLGSCLEELVKVCFESSGADLSRPRMAIMKGRQFDKSREIPEITANLLTGSKRAIRVHEIRRADA
jgi:hypothetical protein